MTKTYAQPRIAVRWLPVEALKPDPRNARLHPENQVRRIADSIEAFGFNVPVLIDGESRVVAGHGRCSPPSAWASPKFRRSLSTI